VYALEAERFERMYEEVETGRYELPLLVEARQAVSCGQLARGASYEPGDYLIRTSGSPLDGFFLNADRFAAAYELVREHDRVPTIIGGKRYRAFISYSRADARIATRIHRGLERFRVPHDFAKDGSRRLGRFFKDDDELAGSEHLGAALNGAIDDSEHLIVIASPDAARSRWVNQEIIRFKLRRRTKVLAVIARGWPDSGNSATECFAPALLRAVDARGHLTDERGDPPLAPDLRAESTLRVIVRLAAGLLDVPFDSLWKREKRRLRQRRASVVAAASILSCVVMLALIAVTNRTDAATLRARSARLSNEQWRFHAEASKFDPAFRAALAASVLDPPGPGESWDLRLPTETTSYALALSGRITACRRVFGDYPELSQRGNYRDDIPGADPTRRLALQVSPEVRDICFSGDGKRIGMCTSDGRLIVRDLSSDVVLLEKRIEGDSGWSRIGMDEFGRTALVSGNGRMHVVDIGIGMVRTVATAPGLTGVSEIEWVEGHWRIAGSGSNGAIVGNFAPDTGTVADMVRLTNLTPYNSHAFAGSRFVGYDSSMGLLPVNIGGGSPTPVEWDGLAKGVGQVKSIALSESGRIVALGGNGSGSSFGSPIQIIDVNDRVELARLEGHTGEVYAMDFRAGSDLLASGGSDFVVRLWSARAGRELLRLAGHLGDIQALKFSRDGSLLATAASDGMVLVWDLSWLDKLEEQGLSAAVSEKPRSPWEAQPTVVTPSEREAIESFKGRPWDIRDWRNPDSLAGHMQSVRTALVRWLGWSILDYHSDPDWAGTR
ncbi:MAG TPA: TIR domain-containing protein, partial [Planctomycetota bacterium]|nr:TIR domain-containing protein [Planctomycetota bacterium]